MILLRERECPPSNCLTPFHNGRLCYSARPANVSEMVRLRTLTTKWKTPRIHSTSPIRNIDCGFIMSIETFFLLAEFCQAFVGGWFSAHPDSRSLLHRLSHKGNIKLPAPRNRRNSHSGSGGIPRCRVKYLVLWLFLLVRDGGPISEIAVFAPIFA